MQASSLNIIEQRLRLEASEFRKRALSSVTGNARIARSFLSLTGRSMDRAKPTDDIIEVERLLNLQRRVRRAGSQVYNPNRHIALSQLLNALKTLSGADRQFLACVSAPELKTSGKPAYFDLGLR